MHKFYNAFLTSICLVILLSGCVPGSVSTTDTSSTKSEELESDPTSLCNLYSPSKQILLNSPCSNDIVQNDKIKITGKIKANSENVTVELLKNGEVIHTEDLITIPTDAAGSYKIIDQIVVVSNGIEGESTLKISQGSENVSVNITIK